MDSLAMERGISGRPDIAVPRVLVIIVTWNKRQFVLNLLDSFADLDYPKEALDILVVDNASNDDTVDAIRERYPQIRLICNQENLGGTGGFNTGLAWAFEQPADNYDYLWLLDNDVELHSRTLVELVNLLESTADAAVAGSTMMQLDYPWRINEMGAFVDHHSGTLFLHRHFEEIPSWKGLEVAQLRHKDVDLSKHLMHCQPSMDVSYVAAASLLIRADVARKSGLWLDFFIHFDDVEWCLRIAKQTGKRVLVSARSLIWHLSAAAKVPTWVLYYDARNILYLVKAHGSGLADICQTKRHLLKKALYYALIGHSELAELQLDAVDDFQAGRMGKKAISLKTIYKPNSQIPAIFEDPSIKRVLVPWTINLQATNIQATLISLKSKRPDIQLYYTTMPHGAPLWQSPHSEFVHLPSNRFRRLLYYARMRGSFDLILQSDYHKVIPLSWLGARILFVNDEGFFLRQPLHLAEVIRSLRRVISLWRD
jgi:GT2 family glycosyltransferase